ncbi:MAG: hypothetical protein KGL39_22930 [Patescibacteria group bacterium]|nr:hypothetical protein [Patescibacteria group bacterium]
MALTVAQRAVADGDPGFSRVDTRTPAHLLPPGVAADATNKRFDDGQARPRHNVEQGPWGRPLWTGKHVNLIGAGASYSLEGLPYALPFLQTGQRYMILWGANEIALAGTVTVRNPGAGNYSLFDGPLAGDYLTLAGQPGQPVTAEIYLYNPDRQQRAYHRFNDPEGFDVTVLCTDDWRDGAGEDGGRGRVFKILANNVPVEISLNGHDIYDTARLVPCHNGLVLLRHGNERHYFQAAAVGNPAANEIQLNCAPAWNDGDQVYLWGDPTTASAFIGSSAPASGSYAYAKKVSATVWKLYGNAGLTAQLLFTGATGRFYLERRASNPGQFGNGAPPLIAQPDATGKTLWEVGFASVPVNLDVTDTARATGVFTVPNHRLNAGDAVSLLTLPGSATPAAGDYYAVPLNDHQLQLFDTLEHAQLRVADPTSTTGLEAIASDGSTGTMQKKGASGLPMPPASEGIYAQNQRLVLVNGNTLMISDPGDPLHYSPMQAQLNANLGEADTVVGVAQLVSSDAIIIAKEKSILALYNFSWGAASWALRQVTHEYGCLSALSLCPWGTRLIFQSRRGLDSVVLSVYGTILPTPRPLSYALKAYVDRIDWEQAAGICVATWAELRLFWAVPLKSNVQTTGNNAVLTLNFNSTNLEQEIVGWEGQWTGPNLTPAGWARHTIAGEERLTFATPSGEVFWLGDGGLDSGNVAIADSLTTRRYTGGDVATTTRRKIFNRALCVWDTHDALLTVTAVTPGWEEQTELTPAGGLAYDGTTYGAGPNQGYNAGTQTPPFNTPFREDYALQNVTELIGGQPDVPQNHAEPFPLREDDWAVQLVIANRRGQCVLQSVDVSGFLGPASNRSRV